MSKTSTILNKALQEHGQSSEALSVVSPLEADPGVARLALGVIAYEDQRWQDAERYLVEGLAIAAQQETLSEDKPLRALELYAALLERRGALADAALQLRRALSHGASTDTALKLARLLQESDPAEATRLRAQVEAELRARFASREKPDTPQHLLRLFSKPGSPPNWSTKALLFSPEEALGWSCGEVHAARLLDPNTDQPMPRGLLCRQIFGPTQDLVCGCGRTSGLEAFGRVCESCGVEITYTEARRLRAGHIDLATPLLHPHFSRGRSNPLALLLGLKRQELLQVAKGQLYLAIEDLGAPPRWSVRQGSTLSRERYEALAREFFETNALTGIGAIHERLRRLDLASLAGSLKHQLSHLHSKAKRAKCQRRLEIVEALLNHSPTPQASWLIVQVLPVLPPELPLPAQGSLNQQRLKACYLRVLSANDALKPAYEHLAPEVISFDLSWRLQSAVNELFDLFG